VGETAQNQTADITREALDGIYRNVRREDDSRRRRRSAARGQTQPATGRPRARGVTTCSTVAASLDEVGRSQFSTPQGDAHRFDEHGAV
jgi:hypothetical protein